MSSLLHQKPSPQIPEETAGDNMERQSQKRRHQKEYWFTEIG